MAPGDMVECPVDGCDYGPQPRSSVLGHYSGKSDGAHPGGYQKAKDLLDSGEYSDPVPSHSTQHNAPEPPEEQPQPDPEPEPDPSSPSSGAQSSNPVVDGPEPSPRTNGETSQDTDEKTCPECEGPLFDFTAYSSGQYHEVNGHQVYVRGDYQCKDCAQWWIDE